MGITKEANPVFETIKVLALNLISISGQKIDLLGIILGLNLFESVFEPFMSGKVYISDTFDMYKNTPLMGNEKIEITFQERSTNIQKTYTFRLYKINRDFGVTKTTTQSKILECYFYSEEKQFDQLKRISRKFWDFPDYIVETIVRDYYGSNKALFVDYGADLIEYYSNYHKGSSVIDFLTKNTVSDFGDYDFMFFESMAGFHFVPLSLLLEAQAVENLTYLNKREMSFRVDDMQFFKQEAYFDINIDAEVGLFGKTLYKMGDNDRYNVVKTAATYTDNSRNFFKQGNVSLFDESLNSENNVISDYHHNHDVAQVRSAQLGTLLNNNKLIVRTLGTLDRKVGDILNVTYPNQDNLPEPNQAWDGSWIILSIKHTITNSFEYSQNLLLAKNARSVGQTSLDDNLWRL